MPLYSASGGSSTWSPSEHDPGERFLGRSIPTLALRTRVCLRRGNRPRTSPTRNLSERSAPVASRIVIVHFLLFLTSAACRRIRERFLFINPARDLLTIPLLAQYYSTNTTWCSLWGAHSWTCFPFLPKDQTEKGGGSLSSRCVIRFSAAGNRKINRQFRGSVSFVCHTLFEIIFFTRSCNGRPGHRRRRRLILTKNYAW